MEAYILTKRPYIPGSYSLYHPSHREKSLPRFIETKNCKIESPRFKNHERIVTFFIDISVTTKWSMVASSPTCSFYIAGQILLGYISKISPTIYFHLHQDCSLTINHQLYPTPTIFCEPILNV